LTPRFELLDPARHDRAGFSCGTPELDAYLHRYAGQNHRQGLATTHVLIDEAAPTTILGYASLAMAQVEVSELQEADRARLPRHPVPALRLARLGVHSQHQRKGHGELLLGYVVETALDMRSVAGVRILVVDAISDAAAEFYEAYGFRRTMSKAATLYLPLGQ